MTKMGPEIKVFIVSNDHPSDMTDRLEELVKALESGETVRLINIGDISDDTHIDLLPAGDPT